MTENDQGAGQRRRQDDLEDGLDHCCSCDFDSGWPEAFRGMVTWLVIGVVLITGILAVNEALPWQ